jgi:hypothetical protein
MSSPISIQFSLLVCSFFFQASLATPGDASCEAHGGYLPGQTLFIQAKQAQGNLKMVVFIRLYALNKYIDMYIYIYCLILCFLLVLFTNIYICAYYVKLMLSIYLFVKLWMIIMMFGRSTECRLRWDTRVLRNSQKARLKYRLSPELLKQWDLTDQTRSDWSNPIFSQTLDVDVSQDKGQMFLVRGGALFVVRGTQGIPHSWARWTVAAMIHDGDEPMDEKGIW